MPSDCATAINSAQVRPPRIVALSLGGSAGVDLSNIDLEAGRRGGLVFRRDDESWTYSLDTMAITLGPGVYVLSLEMPDSTHWVTGFRLN